MSRFSLQQKSAVRSSPTGLVTFNVTDEKGAVRGTISVPASETEALIKCWKGEFKAAAKPAGASAMKEALLEKRGSRTPVQARAATLRGS